MLAVFGIVSYGILCMQLAGSDSLESEDTGARVEAAPPQIEPDLGPALEEGSTDGPTTTHVARTGATVQGFLPKWGEDVLSCLGGIGFVITTVALGIGAWALFLTKQQLSRVALASEAAVAATTKATDEACLLYNRYAVANATNYLDAAKTYARIEEWQLAALRLGDLSRLITQLADGNDKLNDLAGSTREMEVAFTRVGLEDLKFSSVKKKWLLLHTRLSEVLAEIESPFSLSNRD